MSFIEVIDQGIGNAGGSPWSVSGGISILNFPLVQGVSGTVTTLQGTNPWSVSGTVIVSGGISILNFPTVQAVSGTVTVNQGTSPWVVSGGVSLGSPIPPGSNTIGAVNQGTSGSSAWLVTIGQGVTDVANAALRTEIINSPGVQGTAAAGFAPGNPLATGVYDGANEQHRRTPTTFKTSLATTSGSTVLWTPTNGKKFRLMRFMVQVTDNASMATSGILNISLLDGNTNLNLTNTTFIPAASIVTTAGAALVSPWIDIGNGYLSAAANNVLNISLDGTLLTGVVRVTCAGTEE